MTPSATLFDFYQILKDYYGPQHWWPGDTPFEIMVGAVLTQNTNWQNVEKAIGNLKQAKVLSVSAIDTMSPEALAELIRPAGYFNVKSKRLKNLIRWLMETVNGDLTLLNDMPADRLREELLSINGIGRETADSIVLYALNKLTFVVDAYTYRILSRHHCIYPEADYEELKSYCQGCIPDTVEDYNECHALLVQLGKSHCKPKPKCAGCPLEPYEHEIEERV